MNESPACESCSMPMPAASDHARGDETSPYCGHCTDAAGHLAPFEERFERMVQWSVRKDGLDREEAETQTRAFMRTMPAWRDHASLA